LQRAFFEEMLLVVQGRNIAEKDGGVERFWRPRISFVHAGSTEFKSEASRFGRPSHDVNSCPVDGDLGCEMG